MILCATTMEANAALEEYGLEFSLLHNCTLCTLEYGEVLFHQGTAVEGLMILLKGKIKVYTLAANGKDLTLCYYITSGILGDLEFMQENGAAPATSVAIAPSTCIRIPLEQNAEYLTHNMTFMNILARGLSTKLLSSSNAHMTSALYSGEERLCAYILEAEHNGVFTEILSDVSKAIGISYRHLFRILGDLSQKGVLQKSASGFAILDREYLLLRRQGGRQGDSFLALTPDAGDITPKA